MSLTAAPAFRKVVGDEPLPGYRLVEPLGRGGFGEVWKCRVPGGIFKAIKFVSETDADGNRRSSLDQELQAFQSIKEIRHPFILSVERVELLAGELVMVMELADQNLDDRFRECRAAGLPGVPRDELLSLLVEAAEALDVMNFRHGLQHLDVKPNNLFVVSNHLKVGDFGLVNRLDGGRPGDDVGGGVTPLYVAPEVLRRQIHRHSDQYNLALAYQELLTGVHPVGGDNPRQVLVRHLSHEPNLAPLPESDRPAVARALAKDPEKRFPSCTDFILALMSGADPAPAWRPAAAPAARSGACEETHAHPAATKLVRRPRGFAQGNSAADAPAIPHAPPPQEPVPAPAAPSGPGWQLPGYELLDYVGRGSLGDLWKVRADDGRERLARLLSPGGAGDPAERERRSGLLNGLRHPALPPTEIVTLPGGAVVCVTDLAAETVQQRFQTSRADGLPGIPRSEMLDYLSAAATALDALFEKHGLPHLGLTPRALLLQGERLRLADFGLRELARLAGAEPPAAGEDLHQAPEAAEGQGGPASDQYSLALIFAEMVTGVNPRPGRGRSRMGPAKAAVAKWNLDFLTARDRPVIARALETDPARRFASCTEFVEALEVASPEGSPLSKSVSLPRLASSADLAQGMATPIELPASPNFLDELLTALAGVHLRDTPETGCYAERPDGTLECVFPMRWLPGVARLKLDAVRERCGGAFSRQEERRLAFRLTVAAAGFWARCTGKETGLEVEVEAESCPGDDPHLADVVARVRPFGDGKNPILRQLLAGAPALLHDVREQLQNVEDRRRVPRLTCNRRVRVYPVSSRGEVGEVLHGVCHNVSPAGIAFWVPHPPDSRRLYLNFPDVPALAGLAVLARPTRADALEGGGCEAAAAFILPK